MVFLSNFFIIFMSIFGLQSIWSHPYTGYCSLPCPFMCPAPSPWYAGRPNIYPRGAFSESDDGEFEPSSIRARQSIPEEPPAPKPKPKPKSKGDEEIKKVIINPTPPTRRFFTSLFSIPGAVVDTVLGGEIVL